jgi:hypothetical protein
LIVVTVESGLRLIGFRFNPHDLSVPLFVDDGDGWMRTSSTFARNPVFVPHELCHDQRFRAVKAGNGGGGIRIALVGGSTVWQLVDAPVLRQTLEQRYGCPVAVLNMGVLGCGSERELWSAEEALDLDVDVLVVYTGHNEFLSFSNPATYRQPPSGMNWLARNSRIYQLAWWLFQGEIEPSDELPASEVWSRVRRYDEEDKEEVYRQYQDNLRQLIEVWGNRPLVLATAASNLRLAPLVGSAGETVEAIQKQSLEDLQQWARKDLGAWVSHALGTRLLEQGGDRQLAKNHLERAFELTPCPERANARINGLLRELAQQRSIPLADIEREMAEQSPDGIPGSEWFVDNCHLNETGKRLQQLLLAEAVVVALEKQAKAMQSSNSERQP